MSYELDQENADTLINQPAPHVPTWFKLALEQLGGKQLDGRPNLRIVWGQTERRFACGRDRIKYPTSFSAEKADYQFRLRSVATGELKECTYGEFIEFKKQSDAVDTNIEWLPEYKVVRQVEWIGLPRFVIEQFEPSVMLKDTPANWEKNRYGMWFNPETKKNEWTDLIGPYPYNGRYNHFLTVKEDDGTNFGRYSPPTSREIELVRQALRGRDEYKPVSAEASIRQVTEAQEAKLSKSESDLAEQIADSLAPHVPMMYSDGTGARVYSPIEKGSLATNKRPKSPRSRQATS